MSTQQIATGGLIIRKDGKFLIVQRSLAEDFLPGFWELPGGGSEYGETPQQALKREIKEECNLDIVVRNPLTTAQYFMKDIQRVEIIFLCSLTDEAQEVKLSEEHDASAWISSEELSQYRTDEFMSKVLDESTADMAYWTQKYSS